ncbi:MULTISPECIES: hypothetical protein [Streptomyces]|uniref:Uncharacterized protein n=1 Tax=Streptomyces olivaceiscleroticus TaxID=68245 RepID=A0ABP3L0R9_9ACTN|nr:hypothetical protein [Streptomyces niger]
MSDGNTPPHGGFGPADQPPPGGTPPPPAGPPPGAAYGYPGPASPPPGPPGYGYPQAGGFPGQAGGQGGYAQPLMVIGDITVTGDGIITPAGQLPLKGAVWTVTDMSRTEEKMPTYAIVLAVVFFIFCFLGLLFLLMKEKTTTGHIQVTVNSGGKYHSTMIPATHESVAYQVAQQVNYARSLSV